MMDVSVEIALKCLKQGEGIRGNALFFCIYFKVFKVDFYEFLENSWNFEKTNILCES